VANIEDHSQIVRFVSSFSAEGLMGISQAGASMGDNSKLGIRHLVRGTPQTLRGPFKPPTSMVELKREEWVRMEEWL
jgi:hypothetical protein